MEEQKSWIKKRENLCTKDKNVGVWGIKLNLEFLIQETLARIKEF